MEVGPSLCRVSDTRENELFVSVLLILRVLVICPTSIDEDGPNASFSPAKNSFPVGIKGKEIPSGTILEN